MNMCGNCKHFNERNNGNGWCDFEPPKWMMPETLLNLPDDIAINRDVQYTDSCSLHKDVK